MVVDGTTQVLLTMVMLRVMSVFDHCEALLSVKYGYGGSLFCGTCLWSPGFFS